MAGMVGGNEGCTEPLVRAYVRCSLQVGYAAAVGNVLRRQLLRRQTFLQAFPRGPRASDSVLRPAQGASRPAAGHASANGEKALACRCESRAAIRKPQDLVIPPWKQPKFWMNTFADKQLLTPAALREQRKGPLNP